MVELWKAWNDIRKALAGKKTYIMATLTGILVALKMAGIPLPDYIWPIVAALFGDAIKAAYDKVHPPNGGG